MQAIEAALDTAGLIIENGGSTVAANRAFAHVLAGYRKEGATPVWRLDHVIVNAPGESGSATVVRPIATPGINLLRAAEAIALANVWLTEPSPRPTFPPHSIGSKRYLLLIAVG